jgi:DNA-nicking Smr family endonuclease
VKDKPKPRASGPRRLSVSEVRLWRSVTENVVRRLGVPPPPELAEEQTQPAAAESRESSANRAAAEPTQKLAPPPLAPLETRLRQRLARGRLAVDDTLDLHGYRQEEAHRVLRNFLTRAQARGAKLVLVVTGKGRTAAEPGVLRRAVPLWLEAPELRSIVVGFGEATPTHGGSGALYVRLRRKTSKAYEPRV